MNNFRSKHLVTNEMKNSLKDTITKTDPKEIENLNSLKSTKEIEFTM